MWQSLETDMGICFIKNPDGYYLDFAPIPQIER